MPCKLQKKFQFFYDFVYYTINLVQKFDKKFLIENSILSVSYETSTRSSINEFMKHVRN